MPPLTVALEVVSLILPVLLPGVLLIAALKRGWLARLDVPVDGGAQLGGQPLLGRTKTWRGVLLYCLGGALVGLGLGFLAPVGAASGIFGWSPVPLGGALTGLLIGAVYCLGEFINSFVKRRLGIGSSRTAAGAAGMVQYAIDLVDGIVAVTVLYLLLGVPVLSALLAGAIGIAIHAGTDALMRALRLKSR